MRKVKKAMAGVLLTVALLAMSGIGVCAAEAGCDHDWRLYSKEHVYTSDVVVCEEHENCYVQKKGYFVRWICSKCKAEDSNTLTEELHLR